MAKLLRIFISSPGDVVPERRRAALIIEKLARDYARFFDIKPYLWETEPMLASGHFQDAIVPPGETDIVVLILWARLGTPLPERTQSQEYRGIDGRAPVTGTEWEFEAALAARKQRGVPDLLAYKKKAPPKAEYRSDSDLEELRVQLQKLDAFWRRHFVDQGEFRAAFGEFEDLDGFESRLEGDLRRLIERRISAPARETDKAAAPTWLTGSPFRGLETYRLEHAAIFFGRSEATKTAVEHLVENAEAGRPFLLVLGASGAGKSSLAQAGIVPALGVRGVVPGVGAWRRAVIRPGGHPGGPFIALAAGLAGDDALPEVLNGQDVAALARHLEAAAADPSFPIVAALTAREQAARQKGDLLSFEDVRLILVVDQLEELLTLGDVTPDQRKAFIRCLEGLMDSRRVLLIATMRSDCWYQAAEVPLLVTLAEGRGRLDLLPPTQAEITEMIRRPAEVAGLSFETDPRTEIRLDAALAEEAAREPGALPLLSFLLDALYARDVQEGDARENLGATLRYASMRALGGLKGAIATRAEAAFVALPAAAQAALPKVLRALVTVSRSGAEPTARAVPMVRFAPGSSQRRVVEAFLDPQVRLLVADGDGAGARVRVAHEALITHWERARRQVAQDRDDLRTRNVVEEAEAEWRDAEGRDKRGYLLRDPHLANAIDLAERWSDELDRATLGFIQASHRRARLLQQLVRAAATVLALTTLAASALGVLAYRAQQTASSERERAEDQRNLAETQRNQALVTQSRFLADLAGQQRAKNDASSAILFAIEALPGDAAAAPVGEHSRPYVPEAELQLDEAWHALREQMVLGHVNSVSSAAFSPDGKRIVTVCYDTAQQWDTETGKPIGPPLKNPETALPGRQKEPFGLGKIMNSAAFSPDGKRIVTASNRTKGWYLEASSAQVWDAETGKPIGVPLTGHEGDVNSAAFSPDGKSIVTASADNTARLWDAETGQQIGEPLTGHTDVVTSAAFSSDGKHIVTASWDKTARLWDVETGAPIGAPLAGHESALYSAAFSPDGNRIVTAAADGIAQVWDAETGKPIGEPFTGHEGGLHSAAFSPDGKRIVTASNDKTVRLWDVEIARPIGAPLVGHENGVTSAAFGPDGKRILSASNDNIARLWDAEPEKPIGVPLKGHEKKINSAAFSPDGKRIVTASDDKTARLWDAATGKPIGPPLMAHENEVHSAAFSPDGRSVVTASRDRTARLWDAVTGNPIGAPLTGHGNTVYSAVFSLDGKRIVTASVDKTARLWDAATGKPIGLALTGHEDWVNSAAFSPDGKRIVTASGDWTARLWDAETGKPIGAPLEGHSNSVTNATFSPDGKRILTGSGDRTARLWDAETGKPIGAPINVPGGAVASAAFSPDGRRIVTASGRNSGWEREIGQAQVWDAETGKPVAAPLTGHDSRVSSATFSPDGKRIVTASWDKTAIVREIFASTQELAAQARASVPRCLTREQRVTAFLDPEPPAWCIDLEKWPYQTEGWKDWLKFKRANASPPRPDTAEWWPWVSAREAK